MIGTIKLREYQQDLVDRLFDQFDRHKSVLLQAACGSGKTIIACAFMWHIRAQKILFLAHRRELIHQTSQKLNMAGLEHGIIMPGCEQDLTKNIQIGVINSFHARSKRNPLPIFSPDWIIIDECHRSLSMMYRKLLERNDSAKVLGLTATPIRGDGRGLGHIYKKMVQGPSISQLIEMGNLVGARYFSPSKPDLDGIKIIAGDYSLNELEKRLNKQHLVGDVVNNWKELASDRQTIVFATQVGHSVHIKNEFHKAGIAAEHIDGKTPTDERDFIIGRFRNGEIQVLVNCEVFVEGFDVPEASCVVLAKPTKSMGRYIQMAGRGLRPADGKSDCMIIDHSGSVYEHGFLEDPMPWSLNEKGKIQDRMAESKRVHQHEFRECPKCHRGFRHAPKCPHCGYYHKPWEKMISFPEAKLVELRERRENEEKRKRDFLAGLKYHQQMNDHKVGWIYHTYQEKFKERANPKLVNEIDPKLPNNECYNFIEHKRIKYLKSLKKSGNYNRRGNGVLKKKPHQAHFESF